MHPEQQRPLKVTLFDSDSVLSFLKRSLHVIYKYYMWCQLWISKHCTFNIKENFFFASIAFSSLWCVNCVLLSEIGNSYAVLSNPDKRRQYDLTGGEEPSSPGHSHGGGFDFHRGFEADITPEDLFNMFFGGGFPSCKWALCVQTYWWVYMSLYNSSFLP